MLLQDVELDTWARDAQERAQRIARDERTVHLRRSLTKGLSHVINNALQGLSLHADLLSRSRAEDRARLSEVEASVDRISNACKAVSLSAGHTHAQPMLCDFDSVASLLLADVRKSCPEHVQLDVSSSSTGQTVYLDPTSLREVIAGVFDNAFEALAESGGAVQVRTGLVRLEREQLRGAQPERSVRAGSWLFIEVTDNGQPIPAEVLPRVFEPFFSTRGLGRGVGLSSLLGLLRRWGGLVVVEPQSDGNCVRALLPPVASISASVLVLYEDPSSRALAELALAGADARPVSVASAQQALEVVQSRGAEFDAALIDLQSPGAAALVPQLLALKPSLGLVLVAASGSHSRVCAALPRAVELRAPWRDEELVAAVSEAESQATASTSPAASSRGLHDVQPRWRELARSIIAAELAGGKSSEGLSEALQAAFEGLSSSVGGILGGTSFRSIMQRALGLSGRRWPWLLLAAGEPGAGVPPSLTKPLHIESEAQVWSWAETVFAYVLDLSSSFIGADLTLRAVRLRWKERPGDDGDQSGE